MDPAHTPALPRHKKHASSVSARRDASHRPDSVASRLLGWMEWWGEASGPAHHENVIGPGARGGGGGGGGAVAMLLQQTPGQHCWQRRTVCAEPCMESTAVATSQGGTGPGVRVQALHWTQVRKARAGWTPVCHAHRARTLGHGSCRLRSVRMEYAPCLHHIYC